METVAPRTHPTRCEGCGRQPRRAGPLRERRGDEGRWPHAGAAPVAVSKAATLGSPGGEGCWSTGGDPEAGQGDMEAGCQSWGATWTSLLQNDLLPGQASIIGGLFPPWSLDVTAGKNLTIKQMPGREMLMFWILRKWSPWQQGARERTSFFMGSDGLLSGIQSVPQTDPKPRHRTERTSRRQGGQGEGRRGAERQG